MAEIQGECHGCAVENLRFVNKSVLVGNCLSANNYTTEQIQTFIDSKPYLFFLVYGVPQFGQNLCLKDIKGS